MSTAQYDLRELAQELGGTFGAIESLSIFGSRRHGTLSTRSDCDILVRVGAHIKPSDLREFALKRCPALDLFIADGPKAISCINDSYVIAESFDVLIEKLDAITFWMRGKGLLEVAIPWQFEVHPGASFPATTLPNSVISDRSHLMHMMAVEASGLATCPYIGNTPDKISAFLTDLVERMVMRPEDLGGRGQARTGWTVNLSDEYDFQNLFLTVVKPWLPTIGREEIAIWYDEQAKRSDFNLFGNQIIVEMKFIDDANKKAQVVKTLAGLSEFYKKNANVKVLLMLILVKKDKVDLDKHKWEADFTYFSTSPRVITKVVFCP